MIRPYVTVLKDSFHEAFVSRVLWILLILATLALLLLAPLSLQSRRAMELSLTQGIADWSGLLGQLAAQDAAEEPSPGKHILSLGSDEFRELVRQFAGGRNPDDLKFHEQMSLLGELNSILRQPNFYDEPSFTEVLQTEEVEELLQRGPDQLDDDELLYLNRQLFWAAYPVAVRPVPSEVRQIAWFGQELTTLPGSQEMAEGVIRLWITNLLNFFLGTLGVFIAILVTASLIPQTFEAGAADLLLSKPVARPLLYLAKFFGGCAFILLLSTYILAGLWLLLGLRFGMWETSLLKCIPVFLFLFVIYYSVSAAAGLYWKNTIVAVGLSIVFWLAMFLLNLARLLFEQFNLNEREIVGIYPAAEAVATVNGTGDLTRWNGQEWQPISQQALNPSGGPFQIDPAYDAETGELFFIQQQATNRFMVRADGPARLWRADVEKGLVTKGPAIPAAVEAMFPGPRGELILVASSGAYRLDQTAREKLARGEFQDAGLAVPLLGQAQTPAPQMPFKQVSPAGQLTLPPPFAAAMHPGSGDLALFSAGTLTLLKRTDTGEYQLGKQWTDDAENAGSAQLAWAGETLFLAGQNGRVRLFDPETLEIRSAFTAQENGEPASAGAAADGKWFAVLYRNESLIVFDNAGENRVTLDDDVSSFRFAEAGLLAADRQDRLTTYDPGSWRVVETLAPKLGWGRLVNSYLILPLYTILPKPAQLDEVVLHLMTEDAPPLVPGGVDHEGPNDNPRRMDIWTPILTSLAFVAFMLGITCWYVHRMDI